MSCLNCGVQLYIELPPGVVNFQCCQCYAVHKVVQPDPAAAADENRKRKRKDRKGGPSESRELTQYNKFMRDELQSINQGGEPRPQPSRRLQASQRQGRMPCPSRRSVLDHAYRPRRSAAENVCACVRMPVQQRVRPCQHSYNMVSLLFAQWLQSPDNPKVAQAAKEKEAAAEALSAPSTAAAAAAGAAGAGASSVAAAATAPSLPAALAAQPAAQPEEQPAAQPSLD